MLHNIYIDRYTEEQVFYKLLTLCQIIKLCTFSDLPHYFQSTDVQKHCFRLHSCSHIFKFKFHAKSQIECFLNADVIFESFTSYNEKFQQNLKTFANCTKALKEKLGA